MVQFALNTRVNRVTGCTPFSLMYGRHPFPLPTDEEEKTGIVRSREVVRDLWTVFNRTVPKAVLAMREDAQDRAYYPHKTGHFRVGDTVYGW